MPGNAETDDDESPGSGPSEGMLGACFAKKGEYVARNIVGETIIVPVRGRKGDLDAIYNLNEVAGFIWNNIDGETTVRQLVGAVCSEFDVGNETAEAETLQFIAALQDAGLIAPAPGTRD
jgi:hypothetical protein